MSKSTSRYRFVTEWTLDALIEAVWTELSHPEGWPSWWRGVVAVDLLEPGDGAGLGARRRLTFRSVLPYHLVFTMRTDRLERPALIEGRADGELRGIGRWCLRSTSAGTAVRYTWTVEAMKPWMRWLAPVGRPLFKWNHDVVMRWGLEGLRRRLAESGLPPSRA
jgi:uncharacterized protein YndB with AHSA1/START domain